MINYKDLKPKEKKVICPCCLIGMKYPKDKMCLVCASGGKHKKGCLCDECHFERKWGEVCEICGKRKETFNSQESNLPSMDTSCKCKTI